MNQPVFIIILYFEYRFSIRDDSLCAFSVYSVVDCDIFNSVPERLQRREREFDAHFLREYGFSLNSPVVNAVIVTRCLPILSKKNILVQINCWEVTALWRETPN